MKSTVSFTGHRDRYTTKEGLLFLLQSFSDCIWCHGGAKGFDTQINDFAKENNIERDVIYPNYTKYSSKFAPIARDYLIVQKGKLLIALWDGRKYGGTFRTIEYAKLIGKSIFYLELA